MSALAAERVDILTCLCNVPASQVMRVNACVTRRPVWCACASVCQQSSGVVLVRHSARMRACRLRPRAPACLFASVFRAASTPRAEIS